MDELRFVRRDDRSLILANEADEEFRLIVDESVLAELKHLSRREPAPGKVRPREIQALIRAGKTRAQVAAETGLEEIDIERYEEPVLAERRYILERAHAVPVRTDANEEEAEEKFGEVITERLETLGAETHEWSSWKDEATGWRIALEFIARDVAHRAEWAFEHRTGVLSPENSDAVNLSKQGDVGDRLIPKLRAVDDREQTGRFDSGAFDTSELTDDAAAAADGAGSGSGSEEKDASTAAETEAEYERRREIDQRAIKTSEDSPADLSQTADLLDALRKRRGERDQRNSAPEADQLDVPVEQEPEPRPRAVDPAPTATPAAAPAPAPEVRPEPQKPSRARSIWGGAGVSSDAPAPANRGRRAEDSAAKGAEEAPAETEKSGRKGRASIPSWDDILFGTRSDEDPSD